MHIYRVYDASDSDRQVALRDDAGRHHLARIASGLPPLCERLEGDAPALGLSLLMSSSGDMFRAFFEAIDVVQRIDLDPRSRPPSAATSAATVAAIGPRG